jgi:hypothetical protein
MWRHFLECLHGRARFFVRKREGEGKPKQTLMEIEVKITSIPFL